MATDVQSRHRVSKIHCVFKTITTLQQSATASLEWQAHFKKLFQMKTSIDAQEIKSNITTTETRSIQKTYSQKQIKRTVQKSRDNYLVSTTKEHFM